ncbi:MAG: hypothetical protein P8098_03320 [Candidatus Thiodiazotropha sp.]
MSSENTKSYLSSSTTVKKYRKMEKNEEIEGIVTFFKERITERYIQPFNGNKNKNGFIMMASACLMIESLESYWQGWKKSPNSSLAFCQFFSRNPRFDDIRGLTQEFYTNIRCGIMHQGETTRPRCDLKSITVQPKGTSFGRGKPHPTANSDVGCDPLHGLIQA